MFKNLLKTVITKKDKMSPKRITCPYCFEKFNHENVDFRASAHSKDEDDIEYGLQPDVKLIEWFEKFNLGEPEDMNPVIEVKTVSPEDREYVDQVLIGVKDKKGNRTKKRLCPHCHNELPSTAGRAPILLISVIGTTKSGKSVYLTTLINQLRQTAANIGGSILPVSPDINKLYLSKYYKFLYSEGVMLKATNPYEPQPPLIYHLKFNDDPTKQDVTLCFFDVAGEAVTNGDLLEIQSSNIKNSDALMFLVDPTNLESIKQKISLEAGKDFDASKIEDDPSAVVAALFQDFISYEEGSTTKKPTAVVLTKSDLLHSVADEHGEYVKKNSNMFQNYIHKKQFNLTEYQNINGEVKRFISQVDPQLIQQLNSYFTNLGFFSVSALGSEPVNVEENGKIIPKVNGIVNPFRTDEPLLWLLYKEGFINGGNEA